MTIDREGSNLKILIVDDEPDICELLRRYFIIKGYTVNTACSGVEALDMIIRDSNSAPDIILMDIRMPEMDGLELLRNVRKMDQELPIIMVTALNDTEIAVSAMKNGAFDYVTKPIDLKSLSANIQNALEKGRLVKKVRKYRESLEAKIKQSADALTIAMSEIDKSKSRIKEAHRDTIYRLSLAAEFRNQETASHLKRISEYSVIIATALGWDVEDIASLKVASVMHDIGKIGIPDSILLKPGSLSKNEFEDIKKHSIIGFEILYGSEVDFLKMAQDIVLTHHEKWDGSGYPLGLRGEQIPFAGRIVAVVDVFDALTSPRVYKAAFANEEAYSIVREGSGKHFDPMVVRAFLDNIKAIEKAQANSTTEDLLNLFNLAERKEDDDRLRKYLSERIDHLSN